MPIVAGVDSSTQSCTVELRDADTGALLSTGKSPLPPTYPPVSEQDPDDWWRAFTIALDNALTAGGIAPNSIDAISVAAQCHGLVLMDGAGEVLRPVKLWNDTTSAPQAAAMVDRLGVDYWVRTVGSVPTAAFTITKLAWVAQHEPEHLQHLRHICVPHDWLTYRLSGRHVTDHSDASGTGYFSVEGNWLTNLLADVIDEGIDWAPVLPTVLEPSEAAGTLHARVAHELGLRPDVIVGPGAGDQHAGALGLGLAENEVLYSLGTSGVVMSVAKAPVMDFSGLVNCVADAAGGYLPLVCTLNATKVTDTFARLLGVNHVELAELALAAPINEARPVLAAYFDGERSPNRPLTQGMLANLTNNTTREQLALAAFEGVLLGLVAGHNVLKESGLAADGRVVVTGGGANSPAYRQVLADLLQSPVNLLDVPEATARGACVQAATVLTNQNVEQVRDAWSPAVIVENVPRTRSMQNVTDEYLALGALAEQFYAE
ncbi:MAG: xylulokinase [Caldilineaceae bacterium]|nr:xylulokinase [Caldilineaceae bacterium]